MLHNRKFTQFTTVLLVLAAISMLGWWQLVVPAAAQDGTETPPVDPLPSQSPPITVTGINPVQVTRGQATELIIYGTHFTSDLTVQINQQTITPVVLNETQMSVMLPSDLATGHYTITVNQPDGNPVSAADQLQVLDPPPTNTPTNTPRPPIQVTRSEPTATNQGVEIVLSVFGTGFSATSTVRLVGVGLLETTFVNDGAVKATLPVTAPAGVYRIEVADDRGVWVASPNTLMIIAPTLTPPIPPTATERMDPTPTLPAATPIPGQPSLAVRNFSANPSVVAPGGTVTLNFEVVNQGNRTAQGVVVSLDTGSKFVPANGQASATLPNLNPGGSHLVSLAVVAGMDAPKGPNPIPITLSYYDFEGATLTSKATLSVTISELAEASQVVLSNYAIEPDPVLPGQKSDRNRNHYEYRECSRRAGSDAHRWG
ncbi:MAG TPA: IPT/TIG domain-containing protein [Aggregatilineaceae bacterium]|nr:IPT/TIG domain-containing protein [Aggregatilineaceae bacterium]